MTFYKNKNVLVTGGGGFIGSHLVENLLNKGANVTVAARNAPTKFLSHIIKDIRFVKADLINKEDAIDACKNQDYVFHLASRVAGLGYNIHHSGTMMTENSLMSLLMLNAARLCDVERYQYTSSTCVYPRDATVPTPESEGMVGDPEPSNLGYGWAKRVGELQTKMYAKEFDVKISVVRPMNAYGPRDDFNLETAHVVPSLIRKVVEAKSEFSVWGSGKQTRSFVYVSDVVKGMVMALEKYPVPDPLNIGTSKEVSITKLVSLIVKIARRTDLKIIFDTSKPEGQQRKAADTSKAEKLIGFQAEISLEEGLRQTIDWFQNNRKNLN